MYDPIYPAWKAVAKQFHRIVSLKTTTRTIGCRNAFQPARFPTGGRHLQKLLRLTETTLGPELLSTIRICNNKIQSPNISYGVPNVSRPDERVQRSLVPYL
jgi:hypothetical protein